MRGAVSVALVYHFFDFTDKSEHVASIIGMTIIVVVFSTMVFGAATKPLLDLMLGKQGECMDHHQSCCQQSHMLDGRSHLAAQRMHTMLERHRLQTCAQFQWLSNMPITNKFCVCGNLLFMQSFIDTCSLAPCKMVLLILCSASRHPQSSAEA